MSCVLEVKNLNTGYGEIQILWGVSLKTCSGLCTIIGSNGAGKTTLLRAISGIIPVRSGSVLFDGKDITQLPAHKRAQMGVIMVPEGRLLFGETSVFENLQMGAYLKTRKR